MFAHVSCTRHTVHVHNCGFPVFLPSGGKTLQLQSPGQVHRSVSVVQTDCASHDQQTRGKVSTRKVCVL